MDNKKLGILTAFVRGFMRYLQARTAFQITQHIAHLTGKAIIFIDVDDTLITPISKTFRKAPYNNVIADIKHNKAQYPNYPNIISNFRLKRKMMLVDSDWPKILEQLKSKHRVYGLTKMDTGKLGNIVSMEEWRYQELASFGLRFVENTAIPEGIFEGSSFYKGLFMAGTNTKSQTILQYRQHLKPSCIVLIDDRKEQLDDVQQFCQKNAISFVGIFFKGLEQFQDIQDPAVAHFQKEYLIKHAHWLEDEEVAALLRV